MRRLLVLSGLSGALALSSTERARSAEPSVPVLLRGGPPRALAAAPGHTSPRLDLPSRAVPRFRIQLSAPILEPPAADSAGALVVAHGSGRLSQLDSRGRLQWSTRIGADAAASAPVIAADGLRWVFTRAGQAIGFAADGRERYRNDVLGLIAADHVLVAPLGDGGVAFASGRQLGVLDRTGRTAFLAQAREPLAHLVGGPLGLFAVSARGQVLRRHPEGELADVGSFGDSVAGIALSPDGRRLVAVVADHALVSLDLATGAPQRLFSEPSLILGGGISLGPHGELRALTGAGLLLGFAPAGDELFRAPVALSPPLPGVLAPRPLVDARGASAVHFPDAGLSLVSAKGEVETVTGTACPEPLRPTPLGPGVLALACRSGLLFAVQSAQGQSAR